MLPKRKKKPGAVGGTSNGSGGNFTESAMDEFLAKQGLYRKPIAKDGSCLFRAVSEQVSKAFGSLSCCSFVAKQMFDSIVAGNGIVMSL